MIEITNSSFSLSQTNSYTLSIRFLPDGFCFAIFDEGRNLIYFAEEDSAGQASVLDCELLKKGYKRVLYCCDADQYTLLPQSVFNATDSASYWGLNYGSLAEGEELTYENIKKSDIINLYAYDKQQHELVKRLFPSVEMIHRQSVQIAIGMMINKQAAKKQVLLRVASASFDVVILDKGTLLLANTFTYHSDEEFLYFVLNLFDQLKLDQYDTELSIGGVDEQDNKVSLLSKYIKQLKVQNVPLMIELKGEFAASESCAQQFTLLDASFC